MLRGTASKNEPTFCLDKCLSCYIVFEMLVIPGAFFIISTWKLIDQDFFSQFVMSSDWHFEYAILAQIRKFNPQ